MCDEMVMHFQFDETKSETDGFLKQDYECYDFSTSFNLDLSDSLCEKSLHQSFFNFDQYMDQKNSLATKDQEETFCQKQEKEESQSTMELEKKEEKAEIQEKNDIDKNLDIIFNSNTLFVFDDKDETEKVKTFSDRRRFGKRHDREMHKRLIELCEEYECDINGLYDNHLTSKSLTVLRVLAKEVDWIDNKFNKFIDRIQRIGQKRFKFSIRDARLLRRLAMQQKQEGRFNLKEIQYYFPGKSIETLQNKLAESEVLA